MDCTPITKVNFPRVIDKHESYLAEKLIQQWNLLLPFSEIPSINSLLEFLESEMNSYTTTAYHPCKFARGDETQRGVRCSNSDRSGKDRRTTHQGAQELLSKTTSSKPPRERQPAIIATADQDTSPEVCLFCNKLHTLNK